MHFSDAEELCWNGRLVSRQHIGTRQRRSKTPHVSLEIRTEDRVSVETDGHLIAQALAARAAEVMRESLESSTRRLKPASRARRRRQGVASDQFWIRTGATLNSISFQPVPAGAALVEGAHPLNGRQKGMALHDAGFRGKRRQETLAAIERTVLDRLISTEKTEAADDAALRQLLRRNRKGAL